MPREQRPLVPGALPPRRAIAVALHDVEPATYERCALIRDWLDDHGIAKVTLLVIPARDLHPFQDRRPELVDWLAERVAAGDRIAQHGFQHGRMGRPPSAARRVRAGWHGTRGAAEFDGLDAAEARRAVLAGRRLLRLAGIEPRGFVAPAYAYTPALRGVLATAFDWWACVRDLRFDGGRRATRAPLLAPGGAGWRAPGAPVLLRAQARAAGPVLRLDLHPGDLDHPRRIAAIEAALRCSADRTALTYDELAGPVATA